MEEEEKVYDQPNEPDAPLARSLFTDLEMTSLVGEKGGVVELGASNV